MNNINTTLAFARTSYDSSQYNASQTKKEADAVTKAFVVVFPTTYPTYIPYYRINNVDSLKSKPVIDYGLTDEQLTFLKNFYFRKNRSLKYLQFPKLVHHKDSKFPCSVVLMPTRLEKRGIYALLKHREELDNGTFNRIVYTLRLGNKPVVKVFRSALKKHVLPNELQANIKAVKYPQYFLAGNFVHYKGSHRERNSNRVAEGLSRQKLQESFIKEENVKKTGIILDYAEGGTLLQLIAKQKSPLDWTLVYQISKGCAEAVHVLHVHLQLVHYDLKPENIFFHEDNVKIGDFGFTLPIGAKRSGAGTRVYIAPELIRSEIKNEDYFAHPAADIWALGCIFAELCGKGGWYKWCNIMTYAKWAQMTEYELDWAKDRFFPNRKKLNHYDYIIDQCLQLIPEKRPTANQIALLCH